MRKTGMQRKKCFLALVLAVLLAVTGTGVQSGCVQVSPVSVKAAAKSTKKGYKKLYESFLAASSVSAGSETISPSWYYVLNINKSGVPELVVSPGGGATTTYYVYTVKSGKVAYLGNYSMKGVSVEPFFYYVPKQKSLMATGWINYVGGTFSILYKISGSKLAESHYAMERHYPKDEYYIGKTATNTKKVSKKKCEKYCNKYFKKYKTYNMKKNTADNRKKSF